MIRSERQHLAAGEKRDNTKEDHGDSFVDGRRGLIPFCVSAYCENRTFVSMNRVPGK